MVLGKLLVPGRPTIWITVGQGPTALAVGAGGGCLDIFTLIYPFFPLSPSLWETARFRLKYCLKGPLNPKSTNILASLYKIQTAIVVTLISTWAAHFQTFYDKVVFHVMGKELRGELSYGTFQSDKLPPPPPTTLYIQADNC